MARIDYFASARTIPALQAAEILGAQTKQRGARHWAPCILHNETTPSMCFFEDGGFKCFGCNAAGDSTDLYAAYYSIPKLQAAERICNDFGLTPSATPPTIRIERKIKASKKEYIKKSLDTLAWAEMYINTNPQDDWDEDKIYWATLHHIPLAAWLQDNIHRMDTDEQYSALKTYESVVALIGQYRLLAGGTGRKTLGRYRGGNTSSHSA